MAVTPFRPFLFAVALMIVVVSLAYGCSTPVTFEDAGSDPRFSRLIGSEYRSTKDLMVYGVTMQRDYAPILDHYTVTTLPGIDGREVLSARRVAVGTTCRIVKVLRCADCYLDFGGRVEAVVEIDPPPDFANAPVRVKIELFEGSERAFEKLAPAR